MLGIGVGDGSQGCDGGDEEGGEFIIREGGSMGELGEEGAVDGVEMGRVLIEFW